MVQAGLADYLHGFKFDYFCTFTTARPVGLPSIRRIANRTFSFVRSGDLLCPGDPDASMFWAAEAFDSSQGVSQAQLRFPDAGHSVKVYTSARYHWHALLKSTVDRRALWAWYSDKYSAGRFRARCQILPNSNSYSAAQYVTKYISKQLVDYDFLISAKHSMEARKINTENSLISQ